MHFDLSIVVMQKCKNGCKGSFLSSANASASSNFMNVKRLRESYNQNIPGKWRIVL